ncbi:MAG: helix-turn-helix domain-containing protein [Nitrospirae bacterium]|nr:helix-turn-helix domain-containing protein [Nitrospirota bacterium]
MDAGKRCDICGAILRSTQKASVCDPCKERGLGDIAGGLRLADPEAITATGDVILNNAPKHLLTVEEAAVELRYSTRTIRNLIKDGKIRILRLQNRRKILIPREELDRLLNSALFNKDVRPRMVENGDNLAKAFIRLKQAIEILQSPVKTQADISRASGLLGRIPFNNMTAKLYALFLAHGSILLSPDEKAEVLEGFRAIYNANRNKEDPVSVHLTQRSIHWLARSGIDEFGLTVKRLYRQERNPLLLRGMMMGLVFSDYIEPEEFLKSYLGLDSNRLLNVLVYQMRDGDIPYSLERLLEKDVALGDKFGNTMRVLLNEVDDFQNKRGAVCSLRTLNDIFILGNDAAVSDLVNALSIPFNRRILNMLLSTDGLGPEGVSGI